MAKKIFMTLWKKGLFWDYDRHRNTL